MEEETFTCALNGCGASFKKVTHNQKYCTTAHCREATNNKLKERYHEGQAIKKGKKRPAKAKVAETEEPSNVINIMDALRKSISSDTKTTKSR